VFLLARVSLPLAPVFFYFLKVGAMLFGSGYVLPALLHADLVVRRQRVKGMPPDLPCLDWLTASTG
jgi:hypothetical protein